MSTLAWAFPYGLDYVSTEQTTRQAKKAEDTIDREGSAFTTSVREDMSDPATAYISNQNLSVKEVGEVFNMNLKETISDAKGFPDPAFYDLKRIVKSHHGHGLPASGLTHYSGFVRTWLIDFFSDRAAGLTITNIVAKDLKCSPAAAKVVVLIAFQAGGEYSGIHLNLSTPNTPVIVEPGGHQGEPYFSLKKVDLGNGAAPGGLRTEVSSGVDDCSFLLEAEYRDTEGTHYQEIRNGAGRFRVLGVPANPEQIFVVTSEGVIDCGKRPWRRIVACPTLPFDLTVK